MMTENELAQSPKIRRALIIGGLGSENLETIRSYLPSNYHATAGTEVDPRIRIEGIDSYGWTLHDYVIPRLSSGLIAAREVRAWEYA